MHNRETQPGNTNLLYGGWIYFEFGRNVTSKYASLESLDVATDICFGSQ
jgi:hypothetical protein